MESKENEVSYVLNSKINSTEDDGTNQRSEESPAASSVETQPTVSHRSRSSLETDGFNRWPSVNLQSEERVYSLSQKPSISPALNFSRHFASSGTGGLVEEDDVSYADTFYSLDSLSETEDELENIPTEIQFDSSGDRTNSIGSQSDSRSYQSNSSGSQSHFSGTRPSSSQLSSHKENRSKSSSSGAEDTFSSEEEFSRSLSERQEFISSGEGGIRSLSPAVVEENDLPSLGLSSDSSVWSPSGSIYSVGDKFTSADGEIIYYSDFSIEALTARQYTQRSTQRSDILEWSQNLKSARSIIPESKEFVQKKIQLLKRQSLSDEIKAPSLTSARSRHRTDHAEVESVDLKDFCSKKLQNLKNHHTDSGAYKALSSEATDFYGRLRDDSDVVTYGIPFSVIQRLRIDMKSKIDFHEPSACDRCRQKLGQLGMSEFLQSKMAIIREQLTNLKLNHARHASTAESPDPESPAVRQTVRWLFGGAEMYGMKVIGEILSEAACLGCKPELVIQRLLEPLAAHTISTKTITTCLV